MSFSCIQAGKEASNPNPCTQSSVAVQQEAHRLAETFARSPVQHFLVGRQKPARTASLFLGKGTVEDVAASCQDSPPSRYVLHEHKALHAPAACFAGAAAETARAQSLVRFISLQVLAALTALTTCTPMLWSILARTPAECFLAAGSLSMQP